jgi:hypothetical protein
VSLDGGFEWLVRCGCPQQRVAMRKMQSSWENGLHHLIRQKKRLEASSARSRSALSSGTQTQAGLSRGRLMRPSKAFEA